MAIIMSGAAIGLYYFLEFRKGDQFYREGYTAEEHDDHDGWDYYDGGLLYLRRQESDPAIADFDEAILCVPNNFDPLLARGQYYLGKKEFDRALANFDGAIAVNSSNPLAFFYRSNIYFIKGESDKQVRDLKEAAR